MNLKEDEDKENCTWAHHDQTPGEQREKNLKVARKERKTKRRIIYR